MGIHMYNSFIITRTDQFYQRLINISDYSPQQIWIPEGKSNDGISDQFVLTPNKNVIKVLDILPEAVRKPETFMNYQSNSGSMEEFFLHRMRQQNVLWKISRFERTMFVNAFA